MSKEEKKDLADIVQKITIKYDNLFNVSFPYSAGFHPAQQMHKNIPNGIFTRRFCGLLPSKFRVGYEMMANPQRDVTAEYSACLLRALPEVHYKHQ